MARQYRRQEKTEGRPTDKGQRTITWARVILSPTRLCNIMDVVGALFEVFVELLRSAFILRRPTRSALAWRNRLGPAGRCVTVSQLARPQGCGLPSR